MSKTEIIAEISTSDQFTDEEKFKRDGVLNGRKKYGLIWEDHYYKLAPKFKNYFNDCIEKDEGLVDLIKFCQMLLPRNAGAPSLKQFEALERAIHKMGFGLAPSITNNQIDPLNYETIKIFEYPGDVSESDVEFVRNMTFFVNLGVTVAAADDYVHEAEVEVIEKFIDARTNHQSYRRVALRAFLNWRRITPINSRGIVKRLCMLPEELKETVRQLAISIMIADGIIHKNELEKIEYFYTALGFTKDHVLHDLHRWQFTKSDISDGAYREKTDGYLNSQELRKHEKLTFQAQELLHNVFSEEETDCTNPPKVELESLNEEETTHGGLLSRNHAEILEELKAVKRIDKMAFDALCSKFGVLPNGVLEAINDWSIDLTDYPLVLEEDNQFYLDEETLKELGDNQ